MTDEELDALLLKMDRVVKTGKEVSTGQEDHYLWCNAAYHAVEQAATAIRELRKDAERLRKLVDQAIPYMQRLDGTAVLNDFYQRIGYYDMNGWLAEARKVKPAIDAARDDSK